MIRHWFDKLCVFFATGFGSGYLPYMPGTWGTLVAVPMYWITKVYFSSFYTEILIAAFIFGVAVSEIAGRYFQVEDDSRIVWDEIVGYGITMLFVPLNVWLMIGGFILFRIFDVIKPWPIRLADRHLKGGFGVMFDDVLAGIFAAAVLYGAYLLMLKGQLL